MEPPSSAGKTHTHTYIYIHTHTYIYIYTCIYIHMYSLSPKLLFAGPARSSQPEALQMFSPWHPAGDSVHLGVVRGEMVTLNIK